MTAKQSEPADAARLLSGDYGRELVNVARSYATPIFWPRSAGTNELTNGTAFFLDCGTGPFGVTAGHVYEEFENDAPDGARCQIGGAGRFDLRERLISRGRRVDLATFHLSSEEVRRTGATTLTGWMREWPPPPPEVGDALIFSGYPGRGRKSTAPQSVTWGVFTAMSVVSSVNDRDVSSVLNHDLTLRVPGLSIPNRGYDLAGMSGSPLLVAVRGALIGWRLSGIVYECGTVFGDIIKAARADYIGSDGTIVE